MGVALCTGKLPLSIFNEQMHLKERDNLLITAYIDRLLQLYFDQLSMAANVSLKVVVR